MPEPKILVLACCRCPNKTTVSGSTNQELAAKVHASPWTLYMNGKARALKALCPDCLLRNLKKQTSETPLPLFPVEDAAN